MATVDQILDAIAPQFIGTDKTVQIEIATGMTSSSYFGAQRNYAIALRVAHNLTIASSAAGGGAGAVSSKSEGELSISYDTGTNVYGTSNLNATGYGRQLLDLIKSKKELFEITGGVDNVQY